MKSLNHHHFLQKLEYLKVAGYSVIKNTHLYTYKFYLPLSISVSNGRACPPANLY